MKVIFEQQIKELQTIESAAEIIEAANEFLHDGVYFSHLIVDGEEVYEGYENYLEKNMKSIETVEIIAKTVQQFVNDLLLSAEEYIERAKPELQSLAEQFSHEPSQQSWKQLADLFGGIQWLSQMNDVLHELEKQPSNIEIYKEIFEAMKEELGQLEEAMNNEDFGLISDIINYEVIPHFEQLYEAVQTTIDTEGTRPNLN